MIIIWKAGVIPLTVKIMSTFEKKKEKHWILRSDDIDSKIENVKNIAEALGINPIIADLLYIRGYKNVADAKSFMYMESERLSDPFTLKDIEVGSERVRRAVENNDKITVYGD